MLEVGTPTQSSSPVLEALPQLDRVPRDQLVELEQELAKTRKFLSTREVEIRALHSKSKKAPEILTLRDELLGFLKQFTDDHAMRSQEAIISSRIDADKLRVENESLRQAEREVRRMKQMQLVNPHWEGQKPRS